MIRDPWSLLTKDLLENVIFSALCNSNCRLSRSYVQQIKRRKEWQLVFDSTRLVRHIFSQLLLQKTAYNSTHHSDRGQPHSSGERLKESKFVNGGFSWFLHYEAEAEVHKWLTEVDAFLSFCSYCFLHAPILASIEGARVPLPRLLNIQAILAPIFV